MLILFNNPCHIGILGGKIKISWNAIIVETIEASIKLTNTTLMSEKSSRHSG
uniref:Uncharacterized protein n=1 Tax=Arundo donax TaxID=35708 RepID=A0A0A9AAZ5_ARUDO